MNNHIYKMSVFIACVAIGNLYSAPVAVAHHQVASYTEIGNQIINAAGMMGGKKKIADNQALVFQQEMRKIVYPLLDTVDTSARLMSGIYNEMLSFLMDDLELFFNGDINHHDQTLFAKINHTRTIFGEAALAKMIVSPLTDTILLEARQELVKYLVDNEEFFEAIDGLLKEIKSHQEDIFSFWQQQNTASKIAVKHLYFSPNKPKIWNKNSVALEALTRFNNLNAAWQVCSDVFYQALPIYMFGQLLQRATKNNADSIPFSSALWKAFKNVYDPRERYKDARHAVSGEFDEQMLKLIQPRLLPDARELYRWYCTAQAANVLPGLFFKYLSIKASYESVKQRIDTTNALHETLIGVGSFVRNMKALNVLIAENAPLKNGLFKYKNLNMLFDEQKPEKISVEFTRLLAFLQTNTFTGHASFFSYTGRVLAVNKLMALHKEKFAAAFESIGELDACVSIAKLYKKFKNERVHYSFVQYVEKDTPYIKLKQFWNPQVDAQRVVANDFQLGAHGKERSMVLTGSNTGGKSTLLKGVAIDLLLAQTLGIAPGDEVVITPFKYFGTSLNIIDSTSQGKSLYQAEVERASSLIKAAQKVKNEGGLCCLIMDELFRGTSPDKADKETYECAQRLISLPNTSFILATHFFNHPLQLEQETGGMCKNYRMEAYLDASGNIVRTFTLEPGVSKNNIAADILRSALAE